MLLGRFYEDIEVKIGFLELYTLVIGIGSAFLLAILTDKGGTYKKYIVICMVGNLIGLGIMIFSLLIDDTVTYIFDAGIVIFGMFLMPIIPLTF
jgi:hypothetical protein